MIYLQLFLTYLKIGFFGFGGGYAMLSLIQNEVVQQRGWITNGEFADIIALSQMTPGPIAINSATYVGYVVSGNIWGSIAATFAVCLPALTIMIILTRFYLKLKDNPYVGGAMKWMKPMMIGMIAAAALMLIFPHGEPMTFADIWSWAIFAACLAASLRKVNPILLIVLAGAAGVAIYH